MRLPFDGTLPQTQDWNDPRYRSLYAQFGLMGHNGEDYACPEGTRIVAPHGGKVIEALFDPTGYGHYVKLEDSVQGSVLAHLSTISVRVGDQLIEGNEIGFSGNTGFSTAPHLHWGYYRLPRNRLNGFLGYIDQSPDWINTYLPDKDVLQRELSEVRNRLKIAEIKILNAKNALS